jgi:hypothetical protein
MKLSQFADLVNLVDERDTLVGVLASEPTVETDFGGTFTPGEKTAAAIKEEAQSDLNAVEQKLRDLGVDVDLDQQTFAAVYEDDEEEDDEAEAA